MKRRTFVQSALYTGAFLTACGPRPLSSAAGAGLLADAEGVLDLPPGFSYSVISRAGTTMSDGLFTPSRPDGMAAFPAEDGRIALVRNHENVAGQTEYGAFGKKLERLNQLGKQYFYDYGRGQWPGMGGTTTLLYNPETREVERSHLSLAGTELNCAGGPTPWNTWLSCEECFDEYILEKTAGVPREREHGYVFEVDPAARSIQPPKPLPALGRFMHEAAAVEAVTGNVMLTEDRRDGLLYRCVPKVAGQLDQGGQLQVLAFIEGGLDDTANREGGKPVPQGHWMPVHWLDIDDNRPGVDDLRHRGRELGAARFVRGEGMWERDGEICFTCTEGGAAERGQVFRYRSTGSNSGELMLLVEAAEDSVMKNVDNITFTPWGDLLVCEDRSSHCGLFLIGMDGQYRPFASHQGSTSELAGACFAPDGKTLFVNIQEEGLTVAVHGPFADLQQDPTPAA